MLEILDKYNIILGSASPRRAELLGELGFKFKVNVKNGIDESFPNDIPLSEVAEYLAKKKSDHYTDLNKNDLLITADTIVLHKGKILGKPKDFDDAKKMLRSLSGDKHKVITGVCLKSNEKIRSFSTTSDVWFKHLTGDEISYYVEKYEPYDKAGAYGIQEWIGHIGVKEISGSFFNVMGLPVQCLYKEISMF